MGKYVSHLCKTAIVQQKAAINVFTCNAGLHMSYLAKYLCQLCIIKYTLTLSKKSAFVAKMTQLFGQLRQVKCPNRKNKLWAWLHWNSIYLMSLSLRSLYFKQVFAKSTQKYIYLKTKLFLRLSVKIFWSSIIFCILYRSLCTVSTIATDNLSQKKTRKIISGN